MRKQAPSCSVTCPRPHRLEGRATAGTGWSRSAMMSSPRVAITGVRLSPWGQAPRSVSSPPMPKPYPAIPQPLRQRKKPSRFALHSPECQPQICSCLETALFPADCLPGRPPTPPWCWPPAPLPASALIFPGMAHVAVTLPAAPSSRRPFCPPAPASFEPRRQREEAGGRESDVRRPTHCFGL